MSRERLRVFPPFRFRMSPQHTESAAGRVDQNSINRRFAHSGLLHGRGSRCRHKGDPLTWLPDIADNWFDNSDSEPITITSYQIQTSLFPIDSIDDPLV